MKRRDSIAFLAIYAALISVFAGPVSAQTGNVSTDAPKLAQTSTAHKPKVATHPKKQIPMEVEQKPAPSTVPMDFSGMSRRPVDLQSESETKSGPNDSVQPTLGTNSNGGISPGMGMKF